MENEKKVKQNGETKQKVKKIRFNCPICALPRLTNPGSYGKPCMRCAGRPLSRRVTTDVTGKDLDWEAFEELCKIHCTTAEIQGVLKISERKLHEKVQEHYGKKFSEVYHDLIADGKKSLRRKQFEKAVEGGDTTLLIWLGKNYLKQADKQELQHSVISTENQIIQE